MKCKACNGTGNVIFYDSEAESTDIEKCIHCDGTGIVSPMTNEEWLRSCTTMELAEFIRKQRDDWSDGWYSDCHRFKEIVEWLKQPHTPKE